MYSHEIEQLLKIKNYLVSYQEYINICRSIQVNHVKYNPEHDNIDIWTNDNYHFTLKINKGLLKKHVN